MLKLRKMQWFGMVVALLLAFGLAACQTPAGRSAGAVVDDGTITTKVKAKLFDDDQLSGFAISVETFKGEVTLTGGVDSQEAKDRATKVAKSVTGVTKVNNLLKIKK
ncbi:MAG: BON domain-containing protein [Desulfosarcina sp.]